MKHWASWITESVTPTRSESYRLIWPVDANRMDDFTQATRPRETEVEHLVERLKGHRPMVQGSAADRSGSALPKLAPAGISGRTAAISPWVVKALLPAAAMAAATALWIVAAPDRPGPSDLPVSMTRISPDQSVNLSPSIQVSGNSSIAVQDLPEGSLVSMETGRLHFEVDPEGVDHELLVQAGDVEIEVTGTIFDVDYSDDRVEVVVEQGEIIVRHPDGQDTIRAGETWWRVTHPVEPSSGVPEEPCGPMDSSGTPGDSP
ncbi:MAG: FecR family protein, partial [Myxococcota bacterium]|nr:FecR family protein [Myxococcota bacterium]